ncbi:hypothetical protein IG631_08496 [Alternaria alternata]|nr:hypothetical protein IG631_08496 [Alternaria alternata]
MSFHWRGTTATSNTTLGFPLRYRGQLYAGSSHYSPHSTYKATRMQGRKDCKWRRRKPPARLLALSRRPPRKTRMLP